MLDIKDEPLVDILVKRVLDLEKAVRELESRPSINLTVTEESPRPDNPNYYQNHQRCKDYVKDDCEDFPCIDCDLAMVHDE